MTDVGAAPFYLSVLCGGRIKVSQSVVGQKSLSWNRQKNIETFFELSTDRGLNLLDFNGQPDWIIVHFCGGRFLLKNPPGALINHEWVNIWNRFSNDFVIIYDKDKKVTTGHNFYYSNEIWSGLPTRPNRGSSEWEWDVECGSIRLILLRPSIKSEIDRNRRGVV